MLIPDRPLLPYPRPRSHRLPCPGCEKAILCDTQPLLWPAVLVHISSCSSGLPIHRLLGDRQVLRRTSLVSTTCIQDTQKLGKFFTQAASTITDDHVSLWESADRGWHGYSAIPARAIAEHILRKSRISDGA